MKDDRNEHCNRNRTLNSLRSAVEHINWNTLYQQKMALEEVSDMLYAKRKEDDTFGKASAWLESVIALMERLGMQQKRKESLIIPSGTKTMNIWITGSIMC